MWQEENLKTLIYWRHSVRGTGDHSSDIMQEGLAATIERVDAIMEVTHRLEMVRHFFAGPLKRTWQTLSAIMCEVMNHGEYRTPVYIHEEVPEIGSQRAFDDLKTMGVKFGNGKTNFQALLEAFSPDVFADMSLEALKGVHDMMAMMDDDEVGLAVGHSPIIELAAHAAGLDMTNAAQLPENGYIVFTAQLGDPIRAHFPS